MTRPLVVRVLIGLGLLMAAAFTVRGFGHWGGEEADLFFGKWFYNSVAVIGTILCAWRAIRVRQDRAAWSLIAVACVLQVVGNQVYSGVYGDTDSPPVPSLADVFWLAFYVPMIAALALRVRSAGGARGVVLLDIVVAIGALGSLSAAFVVEAVIGSGATTVATIVTPLAYPVGDLVLGALVLHLAAASGWKLGRATALLAACFICWAVADTVYAYQVAHGTYVASGILDAGWVMPYALFGLAAWMRPDAREPEQTPGWRALVVPAGFAVLALAMVMYAAIADVSIVTLVFAAISLAAVIARFVVTYRTYLVVLGATEREATTDALTGLGNRRALTADLEAITAGGGEALLLLYDLNGFKGYNDAFGHPAGDALLERLGGCLRAAVGTAGTAYRMGGDEFCVLFEGVPGEQVVTAASAALSDRGEGFSISASLGRAVLPSEAADADEALRTADQRMYRAKRSARVHPGEQAAHVLMTILSERHPEVGDHSEGVAELAEAVSRHMHMDAEGAREVRRAAQLHDIGKAAIPDAILSKPGPLSAEEWTFMRQHTLIAERIVASADALASVSKLVRSSHERWDGTGYPDRLAGEAIPLGARIIFVCDAFDAMIATRPYSAAMTVDEALAELEHCAGSQFDPAVVDAFLAVVRARAEHPLVAAPGLATAAPR